MKHLKLENSRDREIDVPGGPSQFLYITGVGEEARMNQKTSRTKTRLDFFAHVSPVHPKSLEDIILHDADFSRADSLRFSQSLETFLEKGKS